MIPQLDGLLEVALYVDDVERSTAFYEALFGFGIVASASDCPPSASGIDNCCSCASEGLRRACR
jgi:hypothetical protein